MYEKIVESSRFCAMGYNGACDGCIFCGKSNDKDGDCYQQLHKAAADAIEELSEERKTGRWIPVTVSSGRDSWQCSICGRRARGKVKNLPYCHCGAKMEEPEDV